MLSSPIKVVTVCNTTNYPDDGSKVPLSESFSFRYGKLFARGEALHARSCSKGDVTFHFQVNEILYPFFFFSLSFFEKLLYFLQGIEIGSELVAWGLTKGAEVGGHLMHKVCLRGLSSFCHHGDWRQQPIRSSNFMKVLKYSLYKNEQLLVLN